MTATDVLALEGRGDAPLTDGAEAATCGEFVRPCEAIIRMIDAAERILVLAGRQTDPTLARAAEPNRRALRRPGDGRTDLAVPAGAA